MSLGIKSLGRAQYRASQHNGLSLIPRGAPTLRAQPLDTHVLPPSSNFPDAGPPTQSYSTAWRQSSDLSRKTRVKPKTERVITRGTQSGHTRRWYIAPRRDDEAKTAGGNEGTGEEKPSPQDSAEQILQVIRERSGSSPAESILVKAVPNHGAGRPKRASFNKHHKSATRQHRLDVIREIEMRPIQPWLSTLQYLDRETPRVGEFLSIRVIFGKPLAAEARHVVSSSRGIIRVDEPYAVDDTLVLAISGPPLSVRTHLQEVLRACGDITAVKVPDNDTRKSLEGIGVRLIGAQEEVDTDTPLVTVQPAWNFQQVSRHRDYVLTRRADKIAIPPDWTKLSFENYVASLVHGQIPAHMVRTLYTEGGPTMHRSTVIHLLLGLFTSEASQSAISLPALKMALKYLHQRGPSTRGIALKLLEQARRMKVQFDADVFESFLTEASRAADLDKFNGILREMARENISPGARTWVTFLKMVEDQNAKLYIMEKMYRKGLDRSKLARTELGQEAAISKLESGSSATFDAQLFLDELDETHGPQWLRQITLNKMLQTLGIQGRLADCYKLLETIHATERLFPNAVTLNTMLTHSNSSPKKIEAMRRITSLWPQLEANSGTFHILFKAAWAQRDPNMLRVVWRYAAHAGLTRYEMRDALTSLLMSSTEELSRQKELLKHFEDVIFGMDQKKLAAARAAYPRDGPGCHDFFHALLPRAEMMLPRVGFVEKLQEAFETDKKIHALIKEGVDVSGPLRAELTVDIPLKRRRGAVRQLPIARFIPSTEGERHVPI
ncbi:hypothetical protein GGR56DRAFT_652302 [Xylariaceae sp. FL0804]|nr:hypothetical protein GGR56DRAFT_652302 [Xylariaceae sp. FL0804]